MGGEAELLEGPIDFLDIEANETARLSHADSALAFAQQHLFFVSDARAAGLLKFWKDYVVNRRVPPGSPLDAYAAAEAVRAFVYEIERQVEVAKRGSLT